VVGESYIGWTEKRCAGQYQRVATTEPGCMAHQHLSGFRIMKFLVLEGALI
jgi:hypothetical protein